MDLEITRPIFRGLRRGSDPTSKMSSPLVPGSSQTFLYGISVFILVLGFVVAEVERVKVDFVSTENLQTRDTSRRRLYPEIKVEDHRYGNTFGEGIPTLLGSLTERRLIILYCFHYPTIKVLNQCFINTERRTNVRE